MTTTVSNHSTQTEGNRQGAIRTDSVILAADRLSVARGVKVRIVHDSINAIRRSHQV